MSQPNIRIGRIDSFDLLRGFFLVVILFNHLFYYPSGLEILTGKGWLYASTAEGFFLLSGIVLGIVRGRKLVEKPLKVATKLLAKRSFQLYVTSAILTIAFTIIAWEFTGNPGLKGNYLPESTNLLELIWQSASLQYTYGWADFLRLYAIFIAITPLAIYLLRSNLWYIVMLLSLFVWLQFPDTKDGFMLMPISWQLVFFSGLVIGYHWPDLVRIWDKITIKNQKLLGICGVALTIVTIATSFYLVFGAEQNAEIAKYHHIIEQYFDKSRLPLARLALGALWFWSIFWLVRRYEPWLNKKIGWLFTPLGVNSLYVYTIQSFLVFFMHLLILQPQTKGATFYQEWHVNLTLSLAALSLVWLAVKTKFLFKIIPR